MDKKKKIIETRAFDFEKDKNANLDSTQKQVIDLPIDLLLIKGINLDRQQSQGPKMQIPGHLDQQGRLLGRRSTLSGRTEHTHRRPININSMRRILIH